VPDERFAVYILASETRTLYIGITNDLERRVAEHKAGIGSKFTRKYGIGKLVYVEWASDPLEAIAWEKRLKGWRRDRKIALIEGTNPEWNDLS
jgi:putative endonuclease